MAAGDAKVCRPSMEAKTQSTSCSVRTSSTATAWPIEVLLWTLAEKIALGWTWALTPADQGSETPRPSLLRREGAALTASEPKEICAASSHHITPAPPPSRSSTLPLSEACGSGGGDSEVRE